MRNSASSGGGLGRRAESRSKRHSVTTILSPVQRPPLQAPSDTLQAATATRASVKASKTMRSPAFERAGWIVIYPSGSIFADMKRLTG